MTNSLFPPRPAQITAAHLQRVALVYLRQSTLAQVQLNVGSTARQYHQKDLALAWGWPEERIQVIDADLGVSGAVAGGRSGFAQVLALLQHGHVGALFVVNADRLARNLVEFSEIVTVCDHQRVPLVIDGQVRDLRESGDRLLTVILGAFAEHENRDRQHKLRSSLLAKIREQHLAQGPPPPGYEAPVDITAPALRRRRWGGMWIKSPDAVVVTAIEQVFAAFRLHGTVGAVVRACQRQGLQLPCRVMRGPQYGAVAFHPPTFARIHALLANPNYTDAFVYGKTRHSHTGWLRPDGSGPVTTARRAPEEWVATLRHHHEPYVSWEDFLQNQERIRSNRNTGMAIPRNGPTLLSRRLFCGQCGHAMLVNYGRGGTAVARGTYQCWDQRDTPRRACRRISASYVDPPVVHAVLQRLAALTPHAVREALALEQQQYLHQQRQHRRILDEATTAVTLAERRYKAVDPDNTLVRQQLEREYEEALQRHSACELTLAQQPAPVAPAGSPADARLLAQVAAQVHEVWSHSAVTDAERKEILRALLDQIVCHEPAPGVLEFELFWHGGSTETVRVYRPSAYKEVILAQWQRGETLNAITAALNAADGRTKQGAPWSMPTVRQVVYTHARVTPRWQATHQRLLALHQQGLRRDALAAQLNREGFRTLANERWDVQTVGLTLWSQQRGSAVDKGLERGVIGPPTPKGGCSTKEVR